MNIDFSIEPGLWRVAEGPYRASKSLPNWWQSMQRDMDRSEGNYPSHTIKACTPVFDALTSGYIIPLPYDLHVASTSNNDVEFNWRFAPGTYVDQHPIEQAPIYGGAWKLINPWVIETPPGYSVMVVHPLHRPELPFHTLEAIVDTDTYHNRINFPFLWQGGEYDDVIRAGTPFAQIIPFKREPWSMKVHAMDSEEVSVSNKHSANVQANEHAYRRFYHSPKHYRSLATPEYARDLQVGAPDA